MSGLPDLAREIRIPQPRLSLDILAHRDDRARGLVLDYVEHHNDRGVLQPIMGGRPVYLDPRRDPESPECIRIVLAPEGGEVPATGRRRGWGPRHATDPLRSRRRREEKRFVGRVSAGGVAFDPLDEIMVMHHGGREERE